MLNPRAGAPPARPRIGIAGRDPQQVQDYCEAVAAAGGEPVPIFPGRGGPRTPCSTSSTD